MRISKSRQALQLGYTRSNDPCSLIFLYIRAGKSKEDTKMKHVTFQEYEAAKAEILLGVQYKEDSTLEGNVIRKTYATKENGVFYEVNDGGRIEFWSDKHPESRIYDENERAASPVAETAAAEATTPEQVPGYGELLQEKIRRETKDFNALNDFEKFILNRGYLYDTEEELKAGYDRAWKASHGIMVTAEEFAAEVKSRVKWDKELDVSPLYEVLSQLVKEKKLTPGEVFSYAVYTWCLRKPEAVVFDCAHMTWLWKDGNLYQVYAD